MSDLRVSFFFPVFRDERSVRNVAEKALKLLSELCSDYEIIIVDDGSPDRSGEIADELAREHGSIRVIHHGKNLGYGSAVRSGLAASRFEYICLTDGDDEYEVEDFRKLLKLRDRYDLIITFRYKKIYSNTRIFVSWVYNKLLRLLFRMPFRDVSTGLRMIRKSVIEDLALESTSPFVGAEIAIKAMLKGYAVGEVGIQTFPRVFGKGATVSVSNILATMLDVFHVYRKVFSDTYDLPPNRARR
jgi:glycosyltransferase involved in cell wall biosynthesis